MSTPGDLVVADDPPEATGGNQHQPGAVVEGELKRLGLAVRSRLPERLEPETLCVEAERRPAVGDWAG